MENEISGIILDSQERGRSSRYIKLLSPEGAVAILATKSTSGTHWTDITQPLHQVRYLVEESTKGAKLKEGVVDERFASIRQDFSRIQAAQMMRLVALKIAKPGLPCQDFYQSFCAHLKALDRDSLKEVSAEAILSSFLVKTLVHEGLLDPFEKPYCSVCSQTSSIMKLSSGAHWYCNKHFPSKMGYDFSESLREQMSFLAQNRRLSSLLGFEGSFFCKALLDIIRSL